MLANWFISCADKHLFFFLCTLMLQQLWKEPLRNTSPSPQRKGTGWAHNDSNILQCAAVQSRSTSQTTASTVGVWYELHLSECWKLCCRAFCVGLSLCSTSIYIVVAILCRDLSSLLLWLQLHDNLCVHLCVCVQQVHSRYVSALRKWKLWPALISTKQSIATNQAAKSILREPTGQPALHILALLLCRRSPVMQAAGLLTQRSASEVGEHMSADTGS